jgi:putative transcriptional regulator
MAITMKAARANVNLSQVEMAKMLNISKNTYQNYESYKTIPDIETAKRFAVICGMSVDDIIFYRPVAV